MFLGVELYSQFDIFLWCWEQSVYRTRQWSHSEYNSSTMLHIEIFWNERSTLQTIY